MNQLNKILLQTHNATGHPLRKIAPLALMAMVVGVALFIAYGLAGTAHAQAESGAIPSLTLDSNEPGQLVINWQVPDPAPTDYRLSWANSSMGFPSYNSPNEAERGNVYPDVSENTLTLNNLTPGDSYKVQIRSRYYNADRSVHESSGPWTPITTKRVKNHPPAAPTSLTTSEVAHDSLILSWDNPQDANITGYRIQRGTDADSLHTIEANTESASTNYTDSTVEPETTYHYAVLALSQDGNGARSITSVTTPAEPEETVQNDPPTAPTGLTAAQVTHDSLTLTWDDPQDASITGYRVLRGTSADGLSTIEEDTASTSAQYTDSTVAAETTYHYAVQALSQDGDGAQSTVISTTTPAEPQSAEQTANDDPPPAPTGLTAARVGHSVLTLTWNDPQDNTITGYRVLRGAEADNLSVINSDTASNATEYEDDTVAPETTYHYAVLALSANGAGPQSSTISATTTAAPKSKDPPPQRVGARQITLVHPANKLVSNINHASSGTYTVRPHGDLAIQLPPPAPQESRYEDGWNLNTIKIRVSGVDAGEQISGRLHPGKSAQNNPGSSGPATGVGGSSGKPFRSVSVSPDGIATFSNPDPSGFNPKSQYFYFIVSVNSGEIEVGKTAIADLDAGTPNDLNLGPTWHRADNSWSADSTATDRIQILITGSVKPVDVISPEPPPVPSRPSAPNDGVSTYRLGSWRSVNLTGAEKFGDAIYKVRLQKDTNYRVEFRTANSYASATAIDAGMLVSNNLVDLEAVTSGTGSPFIVEVDEDGNPSTTLAKATSWFRYNTSSLEQGIWSNMLYQDFRTPDILAAGGNADCDAESEAQLVQETDCVYQFDYPTYYYLNIGTGIGVPTGEYGTMQFRISRTSDQTLGGMSRMPRDSEAPFSIPARIEDPVSENGSAVDNKLSADGEIHFAGDVDWYIPEHSATACSFSVAGRDLDGEIGTNDSASGLRMRAYDRNFGERAAPSNRGSFRSSLSGVLPSDGEKLLEVTGTRAGGYRIIVTCEAPPEAITSMDSLGRLFPQKCDGDGHNCNYDDHLPRRSVGSKYDGLSKYGHEVIDLTRRSSASATGTLSYFKDEDHFRILATPGHRYSITLTSTAVTLATPGHDVSETTRMAGIGISTGSAQPYAVTCKGVDRNDGTDHEPIYVFQGLLPTTTGIHVPEFDDDENQTNIKAYVGAIAVENPNEVQTTIASCMFVQVFVVDRKELVGGYRITVSDEGIPPHPARADAHSPLMYDAEDVHLLRGDSPGMHVFITRETYTDSDGNRYPPSSSFGSIAGNGRMDSNDDIDLFRRRVSRGLYDVFIQSEAVRSKSYAEDKSNDADRLSDARDRAHNNTLRAVFSVLEGSRGADAGFAVDLTPGDDSVYESLANPDTAICTIVRQESYVHENTSETKTRPTYECKATTIATFEAEYSDYYYVKVERQYNQFSLGAYRVNMRAVQAPSLSRLANATDPKSRVVKAEATVRNPRQTPVYAQYRKQGETDWIDLSSRKTSEKFDDILQQSLGVEFTIPSTESGVTYNVRASLTEDFSSGVRTLNIRTAPDPAVSRVRGSNLTHNSADVTVSLTNGRVDDYVKIWHKKTSDPDSVTWAKHTLRLSASNLNRAVFNITGLDASTSYDVRAVASQSAIGNALPDVYSSSTFSTRADPN